MKSNKLCGHVLVHNAIEYDYCVVESVRSLLPVCDAVLVLDCSSTDGTDQLLLSHFKSNKRVHIITGQKWEVGYGGEGRRLRVLAEICRQHVAKNFGWQFMLQADEVLHECSRRAIRQAIASNLAGAYYCQRIDLFGSMDTCLAIDPYIFYGKPYQPMPLEITRLGHTTRRVVRDACYIDQTKSSREYVNDIMIFHYGYVRDRMKMVRRSVDLYEWYFGKVFEHPCAEWLRNDQPFDPSHFHPSNHLRPLPANHPRVARAWVEARRAQWELADPR